MSVVTKKIVVKMTDKSKETNPLGDNETDDEVSHEDDASVDSMMDAIEADGGDGVRMTLREMQEAINDESHPQHEEALRRSKELADALKPAMRALNERVAEQISRIRVPVSFDPKAVIQNDSLKKIVESVPPAKDIIPQVYRDDASAFLESVNVQPDNEFQYRRNFEVTLAEIAEAVQERDERAERQVEMAAAQLDVLQTMAANLQQLNQKMESVDQRIYESSKSADKASCWALTVGVSTLVVTIIGIIVTMSIG
ncbi:hypothetical protein [Actinomyces sp. SKVG-SVH-4(1)]|jgi:hypothetical protein|uniref:hypothetical protein n=1 Tax=Actinomyces sp. SKVG-SVH-4(1) TaxID=3240382 RepID=UPI003AF1FEAE